VEIGVVSGDISRQGGADRVVLQTVSGEINLRYASGRLRLKSVSGDIESFNTTGSGTCGTVSGDMFIENGAEELKVESVSSDIGILKADFSTITGHSVSVDIDIRGAFQKGGLIEFDNVSGTIRLTLAEGVDSRFEVETGSGNIRNRMTDDEPRVSKYVRDERLDFIIGKGEGEIILSTRA